ncbi:MAG TPA: hypothetical protein ENI62_07830 [Gammaproteobacteria bacterium]|nr:hypothetical protein [Gammaproteobacteria bacterium]
MSAPNRFKHIVMAASMVLGSGVSAVFALQLQMITPGQYTRNDAGGTSTRSAVSTTTSPVARPRAGAGAGVSTRRIQAVGKTAAVLKQLPDLVIGRLYATANVIHSGDNISLQVKVSNRSSIAIRGIRVRFLNRQSRQVLGEKTLNLAAGAFAVSRLNTPVVGNGRVGIAAILDPNQRVAERNEKNNAAQLQLSITPTTTRTSQAITAGHTPIASNLLCSDHGNYAECPDCFKNSRLRWRHPPRQPV